MTTTKPDLTRTWAAGAPGANVVDPDITTPGKYAAGWVAEVPPFEHFNFLQKTMTQGLAHNNEQGINVWDIDTVYPVDARTKGSDGNIYQAKVAQSGNDPISDGNVNWVISKSRTLDANITLSIPTDFPTLQSALDRISATFNVQNQVRVTLNIETGHVLTAGFRVQNRDLSFIKLTSDDAIVNIDTGFTFVSNTDLESDVPRTSALGFLAVNATMPEWDILVDVSAAATMISGYELDYNSSGVVRAGKGVINCALGANCRVTTNSSLQAAQSNFSGGVGGGVAVTLKSNANLQTANLSGSTNEACLDVSRGSYVHAKDANLSNGGAEGAYARRSVMIVQGANFSNCARGISSAEGSRVAAHDAIFDGATENGSCTVDSYLGVSGALKGGIPVIPSDFITGRDTAAGGTLALDKFNKFGGFGSITNDDAPMAHSEYLTSEDTITITSADQVSVPTVSYTSALNIVSGGGTVIGGSIYGEDIGIRITVDGSVVINDGSRARADDSAGNQFSIVNIPPIKAKTSILIEAYNRSSVTRNLAWKVYSK